MAHIFVDESGDLGFDNQNKSNFFVITFLFTKDKGSIDKCVKKVHRGLARKIKRKVGVLHATKEKDITRRRLLLGLQSCDCRYMVICLNKSKVYSRLHNQKHALYNYVVNILLDRIISKNIISGDVEFIASRRETNRFLNDNFKGYLKRQVGNVNECNFDIKIKTPHEEKGLQAVDFVSWSVYRKYELGDDSYYNFIKDQIVEENSLF